MDFFGAASSLLGGASDFIGGQAASSASKAAANFYYKAAKYAEIETGIKSQMAERDIYRTLGGARADAAASGLRVSGSIADVLRDSARQGALTRAIVQLQGNVEATNYRAQGQAALAQGKAQSSGGFLGAIGGVVGALGSIFGSDDRLKTEIELIERREDGIGIYRFRYNGSKQKYVGVMASEVEKLVPDAVMYKDGYAMIDYDRIGVEFKEAA